MAPAPIPSSDHQPNHSHSDPIECIRHFVAVASDLTKLAVRRHPEETIDRFARAICAQRWHKLAKLIDKSLRRDPSGSSLHEMLAQPLPERMMPSSLRGLPTVLALVAQGCPERLIGEISAHGIPFDQRAPESWSIPGATALHVAVKCNQTYLLPMLAKCGVNPNLPAGDGRTSPMMVAIDNGNSALGEPIPGVAELLECGASLRTLPEEYLAGLNLRGCKIKEDLRAFSLSSVNLIGANLSEALIDDSTNLRGSWYSPQTVFAVDFVPHGLGMRLASSIPQATTGKPEFFSDPELQSIFERGIKDIVPHLLDEALSFYAGSNDTRGNLRDGCLYLRVAEEKALSGSDGTGAALTELLPRLLYAHPPGKIIKFLGAVEAMMDGLKPAADYHPNEAEFMALLRHPEDRNIERTYHAGRLTSALTSIPNWIGSGEYFTMNRETAINWGRIGALNFGFARWKFDAMRGYPTLPNGSRLPVATEPSLLEKFGGVIVENRESDYLTLSDGSQKPWLGRGYVFPQGWRQFYRIHPGRPSDPTEPIGFQMTEVDQRFSIELRQADIKVSHPEYGTLLIANKSPLFGRDNYAHPAYFSDRAIGTSLSQEELEGLTPENLSKFGFKHILDASLNKSAPHLQRKIGALLDGLDAWREEYCRWKCDTNYYTAFASIPGLEDDRLVGAYKSPGFPPLVTLVERLEAQNNSRGNQGGGLALAFVPLDLPPFSASRFEDQHGVSRHQLVITPERLAVLRQLASGNVPIAAMTRTGMTTFFQTGIDRGEELILINAQHEES